MSVLALPAISVCAPYAGFCGKFVGLAHLVFDVSECLVGVCGWDGKGFTPKNQCNKSQMCVGYVLVRPFDLPGGLPLGSPPAPLLSGLRLELDAFGGDP